MSYYHDLITQKSWEELQHLRRLADFVLIGGWAVYLYTHSLKSKDIDILIDYGELPSLRKHYPLVKNDRLKKYEAVREEVQIDIYVPHYSSLGIDVSVLLSKTCPLEGFTVLEGSYLAALKIFTLSQRARSTKGEKDFIDLVSLVNSGAVELPKVRPLMESHGLSAGLPVFLALLAEHTEVPEIGLTKHAYAKIRKRITAELNPKA